MPIPAGPGSPGGGGGARLLGPTDVNIRSVWTVNADGKVFTADGLVATIYSDSACTVLADVAAYQPGNPGVPGAVISGSQVLTDGNSCLPIMWFPQDGTDTLYARVNGGPPIVLYADYHARINNLDTGNTGNLVQKSANLSDIADPAAALANLGGVTGSAVVHNTGTETIAGVKTFSNAPVVPSGAFPQTAVTNLATDLASKATDSAVVHLSGTETIAGAKTFSSAPVVPNGSFTAAKTAGTALTTASALSELTGTAAAARTNIGASADSAVVHNTGVETIAGAKTFSTAPVVPDSSFTAAKTAGTALTAANGLSELTGSATAARTNIAAVGKGELVFSVKDYGAVGDNSTDDTTAISNAATAAASAGATLVLSGTHAVSALIDLPSGVVLDGTRGSLRQTSNLTTTLRINNATNVTVRNVKITGVGSDWVNNSSVYGAAGISVTGTTSNVLIEGCTISNVAGGGIILNNNVASVVIRNCVITGPGAPPIVNTTSNFGAGIGLFDGISNLSVSGCEISQSAQGIVTGQVSQVRIVNNYIHDIVGQHGLYLEPNSDVVIAGNLIKDTILTGMKLQVASISAPDVTQVSITGNVFSGTGADCILLTNPIGGSTARLRRVTITGNTGQVTSGGGDGVQCIFGDGVVISGNTFHGARKGLNLTSSANLTITNNRISNCTDQGINLTDTTGVMMLNNRVVNPATANGATTEFGIEVQGASSDVTIDGNIVSDANANMRYGLVISADQPSCVIRNNDISGATDYAVDLDSSKNIKQWQNNNLSGTIGTVTGFPTALVVNGAPREYLATAAPTTGTFKRGDVVWNTTPTTSSALGWVCVTAGTPGTWTSFGAPAGGVYAGPPSNAYLGAPFDPVLANVNAGVLAVGILYLIRVDLTFGGAINAVRYVLGAAGSVLTSGQNLIGVYDSTGTTLLASSADQTTGWGTTGVKETAMTAATPAQAPGTAVYVAFLSNGTTGPNPRGFAATSGSANDNLGATTYRWATAGSGLTALPSTIPTMAASTAPIWIGLK